MIVSKYTVSKEGERTEKRREWRGGVSGNISHHLTTIMQKQDDNQ